MSLIVAVARAALRLAAWAILDPDRNRPRE